LNKKESSMRVLKLFIWVINGCLIHSVMQSAPYQYRRIVIAPDNKIIKTVDLISDFHFPLHELVKKPSRARQKLLTLDERSAFTTAERTLLVTLRALAQKNKPIELLWEQPASVEGWEHPELNDIIDMDWILYSHRLKDEFSPEKNKSVVYKNSDTYRIPSNIKHDPEILLLSNRLLKKFNVLQMPIKEILSFVGSLLDPKTSKAFQDLENVKKYQFKNYYEQLVALWQKYSDNNVQPLHIFLEKLLMKNPTLTAQEARKLIEDEGKDKEIKSLVNLIIDLPDIEFLIKLFASPNDHSIIYAGGDHCDKISELLINDFNGKEIVNLGTTGTSFETEKSKSKLEAKFIPVLAAKTWVYLAEDPQQSFARFRSRGRPFINLASDAMWHTHATLQNQIQEIEKMRLEKKSVELKEEDIKMRDALTAFYKKSSKTFIDFINIRDKNMHTLLFHAVLGNLFETSAYLIQHGARVNALGSLGNTPLFYAKTADMAELLLRNGAIPDVKNMNAKTPAQVAKDNSNEAVASIIEKFVEKEAKKKKTKAEIKEGKLELPLESKESKQEIPECEISVETHK
jgi:hypothetical protein